MDISNLILANTNIILITFSYAPFVNNTFVAVNFSEFFVHEIKYNIIVQFSLNLDFFSYGQTEK